MGSEMCIRDSADTVTPAQKHGETGTRDDRKDVRKRVEIDSHVRNSTMVNVGLGCRLRPFLNLTYILY